MSKQRRIETQSIWDLAMLTAAFEEIGVKEAHAARLLGHLIRHPEADWSDVPDLPKAAVEVLKTRFAKHTTKVVTCVTSSTGETTKLLIRLQDGLEVEAVVMRYDTSGTMGLKGNLTAGEIIEQMVHARAVIDFRNVVFMGMGEPLMNYEQLKRAAATMTDSRFFGLKRKKVTVSTVGVIPRLLQLAQDLPGVSLALSLHAPTQELREQIVPSARAYKLPKLMDAVHEYQQASGQCVFVQYVVLAGVNDGLQQAKELGELLAGRNVIVNLIPWNPIYSPSGPFLEAPAIETVKAFQHVLSAEYDLHCTIRQEMGQDIAGACGQLVVDHSKSSCSGEGKVDDIEELGKRTAVPV